MRIQSSIMLVYLLIAGFISIADDKNPAELDQLKSAYQTQAKAAMDPINKKYMAQLDELKKKLGGKGDLEGAQKCQKELDSIASAYKDRGFKAAPTGIWVVTYKQLGIVNIYSFKEDGTVELKNENTTGILEFGTDAKSDDFTIKFDIGKCEKWTATGKGKYSVEHYTSPEIVKGMKPSNTGTAEPRSPDIRILKDPRK